jgi:hypothetical protein
MSSARHQAKVCQMKQHKPAQTLLGFFKYPNRYKMPGLLHPFHSFKYPKQIVIGSYADVAQDLEVANLGAMVR